MQNMASWNLDHKLFALTLDDASSYDVCVDTVISTLKKQGYVLWGKVLSCALCCSYY
jgi:hypothetical protein